MGIVWFSLLFCRLCVCGGGALPHIFFPNRFVFKKEKKKILAGFGDIS